MVLGSGMLFNTDCGGTGVAGIGVGAGTYEGVATVCTDAVGGGTYEVCIGADTAYCTGAAAYCTGAAAYSVLTGADACTVLTAPAWAKAVDILNASRSFKKPG